MIVNKSELKKFFYNVRNPIYKDVSQNWMPYYNNDLLVK
jgi:hypothetical protein